MFPREKVNNATQLTVFVVPLTGISEASSPLKTPGRALHRWRPPSPLNYLFGGRSALPSSSSVTLKFFRSLPKPYMLGA